MDYNPSSIKIKNNNTSMKYLLPSISKSNNSFQRLSYGAQARNVLSHPIIVL